MDSKGLVGSERRARGSSGTWQIPEQPATWAFILHSGIINQGMDKQSAVQLHRFASGAYLPRTPGMHRERGTRHSEQGTPVKDTWMLGISSLLVVDDLAARGSRSHRSSRR